MSRESDGEFILSLHPSTLHFALHWHVPWIHIKKGQKKFDDRLRENLLNMSNHLKRVDKREYDKKRYQRKKEQAYLLNRRKEARFTGEIPEEYDLSTDRGE